MHRLLLFQFMIIYYCLNWLYWIFTLYFTRSVLGHQAKQIWSMKTSFFISVEIMICYCIILPSFRKLGFESISESQFDLKCSMINFGAKFMLICIRNKTRYIYVNLCLQFDIWLFFLQTTQCTKGFRLFESINTDVACGIEETTL